MDTVDAKACARLRRDLSCSALLPNAVRRQTAFTSNWRCEPLILKSVAAGQFRAKTNACQRRGRFLKTAFIGSAESMVTSDMRFSSHIAADFPRCLTSFKRVAAINVAFSLDEEAPSADVHSSRESKKAFAYSIYGYKYPLFHRRLTMVSTPTLPVFSTAAPICRPARRVVCRGGRSCVAVCRRVHVR